MATTIDQLRHMAASVRAGMLDPGRSTLVGDERNPRFELFHAASSLCSQKVRTVLHEKRLSWRSNDMVILCAMGADGVIAAEHYNPAYVRLRLIAGREMGQALVSGYSGRTSVETEGFDPCAVPLLIDYEAGRVIADSKRICCYLDEISREPVQLLPVVAQARAEVMRQVSIVDQLPNAALLYGFHPDADRRPESLKSVMETVYDYKVTALQALAANNAGDAELVAAYQAKIAKENGGKRVCHNAEFQRAARQTASDLLRELDRSLSGQSFPYLNGHEFSLADVAWGVNLIRMAYLGLASLWNDLPNVERYFEALTERPSLCREAIGASIESLPPSDYFVGLKDCSMN
ncbi:glutathione S-transferase family protein [Pseudomonas sp. REP124]|uniref:glutathione S-transferase family protein n=1 Tax=Pseudomonas sp. REP124 TaxID=2875731 RepID=UPI001CCD82EC|nr:glutathione S-transferase family protein [Pseudomonas sp. REP124]MBZ9780331.1 glutathione S-transferase family protein [Pseudomonas sp. REP124]